MTAENLLCCCVVVGCYLTYALFGQHLYCTPEAEVYAGSSFSSARPAWCDQGLIPGLSLYTHVQDHYWYVFPVLSSQIPAPLNDCVMLG